MHEECIEEFLDDELVVIGELFDLLKLSEQLAIFEVGFCGVSGGAFNQVVAGDTEDVCEALEGVGRGSGDTALVATDVGVVEIDFLTELALGEALGLPELTESLGKCCFRLLGYSIKALHGEDL